jgi:choline dehydrogenase-like flavoprotein
MPEPIDARALPESSQITADLIIIGGGMAGIAIAREFGGATTGLRVAVIESGGMAADPAVQDLYAGEGVMTGPEGQSESMADYPLNSRRRMLGGSGNAWGGKCGPLDPADFVKRDWVPGSGWPVTRAQLQPYFDRACDLLELPHFDSDGGPHQDAGRPAWDLGGVGEYFPSPRRYTRFSGAVDRAAYDFWRTSFTEAANVALYLNANVREIRVDRATGAVSGLDIACLNGRRHSARGRRYILAVGGIENARLLLASHNVEKDGLGNRAGLVGRYFMGHATFGALGGPDQANTLLTITTPESNGLYADSSRAQLHCVFAQGLAAQARNRAGNFTTTLTAGPPAKVAADADGTAIFRLGVLVDEPRNDHWDERPVRQVPCFFMTEHIPDPQSRVTLGSTSDVLGMPRIRLDWHWSKAAVDGLERSIAGFARALGAAGKARLAWPVARKDLLTVAGASRHHMGTTRMNADPALGVVDNDSRVHGVANLYIAGSSIFPTSGIVNPTLTLLAMTYRLCDHLKREFAK